MYNKIQKELLNATCTFTEDIRLQEVNFYNMAQLLSSLFKEELLAYSVKYSLFKGTEQGEKFQHM